MADPTAMFLGYGGFCAFDWKTSALLSVSQTNLESASFSSIPTDVKQHVFLTNGNITVNHNLPLQATYCAPSSTANASELVFGVGTANITGSVGFDMTYNNIGYFIDSSKLKRNTYFNMIMSDGNRRCDIFHNVFDSITFAASNGGFVTCSINFQSLNKHSNSMSTMTTSTATAAKVYKQALVAYWQAGISSAYIDSFSLNFTQGVTPIYLNNDLIMPSYLRCGTLNVNAQIQSCFAWQDATKSGISKAQQISSSMDKSTSTFDLFIGGKTVSLNNPWVVAQSVAYSGIGDVAKFSYTVQAVNASSSSASLFSIT